MQRASLLYLLRVWIAIGVRFRFRLKRVPVRVKVCLDEGTNKGHGGVRISGDEVAYIAGPKARPFTTAPFVAIWVRFRVRIGARVWARVQDRVRDEVGSGIVTFTLAQPKSES